MATLRRAGFGSVFEVENETVGIGTTGTATNTVQVLGETKASLALVTGLSTLTTYQGFVDSNAEFGNSNVDINSQSGTMGNIEICHGDFNVSSASTLTSSVNQLTLTDSFSVPTGNTDSRIHCQTAGSMRFNEDLGTLEFYTGDEWRTVNSFKDTGNRGRGIFAAGYNAEDSTETEIITYIQTSSLGNAQDFGDMDANTDGSRRGGCSDTIRGLAGGGTPAAVHIDYITMASTGDSIDFGNLNAGRYMASACSSSTRGVWMAGYQHPSGSINAIDYVQIQTLGNALDFGDTTVASRGVSCAASPTRGFCLGITAGDSDGLHDTGIDMITFSSTGNAIDFGTLQNGVITSGAGSNHTRAVVGGRQGPSTAYAAVIQRFEMNSGGNAVSFGDLTVSRSTGHNAVTNATRIVWGGGFTDPNNANVSTVIDYLQFASEGNAQNFGDMGTKRDFYAGICDTHGGLGGF